MLPITLLPAPKPNAWGYTGPAAHNPYFHTNGVAPDATFVPGFALCFRPITMYNRLTGQVDSSVNIQHGATAEAAIEALRLVRMFIPDAVIAVPEFNSGPYFADAPTLEIQLPDGTRHNAARILVNYYHGGAGVSAESDNVLVETLGLDKAILPIGVPPAQPDAPTPADPGKDNPHTPDGEGPLGYASPLSAAQHELGAGSENYAVGDIFIDSKGVKHLRESTYWRVVQ